MHHKSIWIVILILVICLCLTWKLGLPGSEESNVSVQRDEFEENRIRDILRQRTTEHQDENQRMLEAFQKSLEEKGRFIQSERNIRPFVEQVTSFNFSYKLCSCILSDYLNNTATAIEMLSPALMEHIIIPCEKEASEIENALKDFLLQLQERDTLFKAGLTDYMKLHDISGMSHESYLETFLKENTELAKKVQSFAVDKMLTAIGTAMEALFIRSTYECIKKLMLPIIKRLAASWTACGVSSVSDGPLPIMDIIGAVIAIGGTAWTAYDVYQITNVLPIQLEYEVLALEERYRMTIMRKASESAEEAMALCAKDYEEFLLSLNRNGD